MNINNNILSNGKEAKPCPECGKSEFLIERSTHIEHWIPPINGSKNFISNTFIYKKVNYKFDVVFCKECGLTRQYNFDVKKDATSYPPLDTLTNAKSNVIANSSISKNNTIKIIVAVIIIMTVFYATWILLTITEN